MKQHDFLRLEATIDISEDDDLTPVIDFGIPVRLLWVDVPTITSATVDIQVSPDDHHTETAPTTFRVIETDILGGAGTGATIYNADAATDINGFRYFKIATSAGQGADRTFSLGAEPAR